jgi:hypothetical protein
MGHMHSVCMYNHGKNRLAYGSSPPFRVREGGDAILSLSPSSSRSRGSIVVVSVRGGTGQRASRPRMGVDPGGLGRTSAV